MKWLFVAAYVTGFVFVLVINGSMPVTPALMWARAAVWPAWLLFGWPQGAPMPMD